MAMMATRLEKRRVHSYQTKSQHIAELCELRKECIQRRVRALLRGDAPSVQYNTQLIDGYTDCIREMHKPPYLRKKRK